MHVRCPHCHNPIDVVDDEIESDLTCPSCGSGFSLVRDLAATQTDDRSSKIIAQFELIREIGKGSFGSVWMARDIKLDRTVAVKIPHRDSLDPREAEIFLRDARAAAQLRHPSIVSVHEVGKSGNAPYIVSDYIEGANLKSWLLSKRLTFREVAELLAKVAEAVQHAHEHGVVHRDLKPSNIVLDLQSEPHVIDFGMAKREAGEITMTVEGQILGTPAYMSPEQASGKGHEADARSDIYSLGVILYELLTGELPFRGDTQMLLVQIKQDDPPRPRKLNSKIPKDLETIALKCIEKDPNKRYQTAKALSGDFNRWLDGQPITARPISSLDRSLRWCQRNPAVSTLLVAVIALLGAIATTSTVAAIQIARARDGAVAATKAASAAYARESEARIAESNAKETIAKAHALSQERLSRIYIAQAQDHFDSSDPGHALPYLADALTIDSSDSQRLQMHRVRFQRAFSTLPRIVRFWPNEDSVARAVDSHGGIARISHNGIWLWDGFSGRRQSSSIIGTHVVERVRLSANRQRLLLYDAKQGLLTYDIATGELIGEGLQLTDYVYSIAISHDGTMVAACCDTTVHVWDPATGKRVCPPLNHDTDKAAHNAGRENARFSDNGQTIFTFGYDDRPRRFSLASGGDVWNGLKFDDLSQFRSGSRGDVLDISPDETLAVVGGRRANVIRLSDNQILHTLQHNSWLRGVRFSPDGRRVATVGGDSVGIWDTNSGNLVNEIVQPHSALDASFSSDGELVLISSADNAVRVWDANSGRLSLPPLWHDGPVGYAAFRAADRFVVTAVGRTLLSDFTVWDLASTHEGLQRQPSPNWIASVAWNKSSSELATASGLSVEVRKPPSFDVASARLLPVSANRLVFNDSAALLASCYDDRSKDISVFDIRTGHQVGQTWKTSLWRLDGALFDPTGRFVLTHNSGSKVEAREFRINRSISFPELERLSGHLAISSELAFSADGQVVAICNCTHIVDVVQVATGKLLHRLHLDRAACTSLAMTPDGKLLCIGDNAGNGHVFDLTAGARLTETRQHRTTVEDVAITMAGDRIATASQDRTARVWSTATGEPLVPPLEHRSAVTCVRFSPDGRFLATGEAGGRVSVWDSQSGESIGQSILHGGQIREIAFSVDSMQVVSLPMERSMTVFSLTPTSQSRETITQLSNLYAARQIDLTGGLVVRAGMRREAWDQLTEQLSAAPEIASYAIESFFRAEIARRRNSMESRNFVDWVERAHQTAPKCVALCKELVVNLLLSGEWQAASKVASEVASEPQVTEPDRAWIQKHRALALLANGDTLSRTAAQTIIESLVDQIEVSFFERNTSQGFVWLATLSGLDPPRESKIMQIARDTAGRWPLDYDVHCDLIAACYRADNIQEIIDRLSLANDALWLANQPNVSNEATYFDYCRVRALWFRSMAFARVGNLDRAKSLFHAGLDWVNTRNLVTIQRSPDTPTTRTNWKEAIVLDVLGREVASVLSLEPVHLLRPESSTLNDHAD